MTAGPPTARSLHEIRESTHPATCAYRCTMPGEPCAFSAR